MPELKESTTAALLRGQRVNNGYTTEPYEVGWATEALFFILTMKNSVKGMIHTQFSPDGINWTDTDLKMELPPTGNVSFIRISHFGNWLRFRIEIPEDSTVKLMGTLHIK